VLDTAVVLRNGPAGEMVNRKSLEGNRGIADALQTSERRRDPAAV